MTLAHFAAQIDRIQRQLWRPLQTFHRRERLTRQLEELPVESWHGTLRGYTGHHCRCWECGGAYRRYRERKHAVDAARRERRQAQGLCERCPQPAVPGQRRCARCMHVMAEGNKRRYFTARAQRRA